MSIQAAYLSAIISSVSFGLASVVEKKATAQVGSLAGLNLKNFFVLSQRPLFIAGLLLDLIAYVAFILAVRSLPLFFVQAVGTASILIAALTARLLLKERLSKQAYACILLILFGLMLVSLATGPAETKALSMITYRSFLAFAVVTACTAVTARKILTRHPVFAAAISGLCFSATAIITRILIIPTHWWSLIVSPAALLIAINGILGLTLFSVALQSGSAPVVYGIDYVVETIVPTLLGIGLLGDAPLHHRWGLLVIGLVTILLSVFLLAYRREKASYD